jgi:hypothetical protein
MARVEEQLSVVGFAEFPFDIPVEIEGEVEVTWPEAD